MKICLLLASQAKGGGKTVVRTEEQLKISKGSELKLCQFVRNSQP